MSAESKSSDPQGLWGQGHKTYDRTMFVLRLSRVTAILENRGYTVVDIDVQEIKLTALVEREADLVALVTLSTGEVIVLYCEFQAWNDPTMADRMLLDSALLAQQYPDHRHLQILIYIGYPPLRMKRTRPQIAYEYAYVLIDTRDIDAEFLLAKNDLQQVVLALLFKSRYSHELASRIMDRIIELSPDMETMAKSFAHFFNLSNFRKLSDYVYSLKDRMPFEIILDEESNIYQEMYEKVGRKHHEEREKIEREKRQAENLTRQKDELARTRLVGWARSLRKQGASWAEVASQVGVPEAELRDLLDSSMPR